MPRKRLSEFDINKKIILARAKEVAGNDNSTSLRVVLNRICEIPEYSCSIDIKKNEGLDTYVEKWTRKFIIGYNNKSTSRISNPINTAHDAILDEIITTRLDSLTIEQKEYIKYGHRLSMSAENIAGSLLEEYIANELIKYKWHCCWGETMKSIDFCHENGALLQVKNSDNSENSSSKTVRDGTKIQHWFRRFSRTGNTNWDALNALVGISKDSDKLSEEKYKSFVRKAIKENPNALFVEEEGPWQKKTKKG